VIKAIHKMAEPKNSQQDRCKHLLQQRIKTSKQNAFFALEWRSANRCDGVSKLCYISLI